MMKIVVLSVVVFLTFIGCSAKHQLSVEAKEVRLYDVLPSQMHCSYKGEIVGSEGTFIDFLFISNRELTEGARADLRNQAALMGANTVVIQRGDFMYTTSTVFIGQAYDCQP
jgi:hypothetical protein